MRILLASAFTLLSGCAAFNYSAPDAPTAYAKPMLISPAPRIAVVLGSGGPRGYAHIGVIKALEAQGIEPDLVVGSSVGALIGAFWASGLTAQQLDVQSKAGGPLTLFDINPFADRGWIQGQRLQDYVNRALGDKPIEGLGTPFIAVATQRASKSPVLFSSGNAGVAIRASSAVPGVISPVGIAGVEYEDGDVSLPLAVGAARAAGAQFVIAVDVSAYESSTPLDAKPDWVARDKARRLKIAPEAAMADFLIHPDLGYVAAPSRSYFDKATALGEQAALQRAPALVAALRERFGAWPVR